ncbi:rCG52507 [Rattus norvegicus]|uniref:RCG52507 n=1 Tax=Rattus norvegicus TaxID=10116 RepID=A6K0T0_RAT|nr:rCG52507 [Rattus norvegicus]
MQTGTEVLRNLTTLPHIPTGSRARECLQTAKIQAP